MKIQKGFLLGSVMWAVEYKGQVVFNHDLGKAIYMLLTGIVLK
jgi:hypothetical protein